MLITKLDKTHNRKGFNCGNEPLNRFIKQLASQVIKRNETVIYVAHEQGIVTGYYTLSTCHIEVQSDAKLFNKQTPHNPIPCVLLGRLAVNVKYKGKGLGSDLLLHALQTVKKLSELVGVAYVVVDAKDETAKSFYQHYQFAELTNQPLRLCYAIKDIPM